MGVERNSSIPFLMQTFKNFDDGTDDELCFGLRKDVNFHDLIKSVPFYMLHAHIEKVLVLERKQNIEYPFFGRFENIQLFECVLSLSIVLQSVLVEGFDQIARGRLAGIACSPNDGLLTAFSLPILLDEHKVESVDRRGCIVPLVLTLKISYAAGWFSTCCELILSCPMRSRLIFDKEPWVM